MTPSGPALPGPPGGSVSTVTTSDGTQVDLEVDSHSPTGATRLYERIGFTHKFTTSTLRKDGAGR